MIASLIRQTTTLAIAAAATLIVVTASAAPAQAATPSQIRVDISGYNLASDHGRDLAAARLRRAAAKVCDVGGLSLAERAAARACTATALAQAMPRLQMQAAAARDARTEIAVNDLRGNHAGTARDLTQVTR
jgi:UrcA family protein